MAAHCQDKMDDAHKNYRTKRGGSSDGGRGRGQAAPRQNVGYASPPRVGSVVSHGSSDALLRQQIEFYLSDDALLKVCQLSGQAIARDHHMLREMGRAPGQWVRLSFLAELPKLKGLLPSADISRLANAVASSTGAVEINISRTEIRRKKPLPGMIEAMEKGELVLLHQDEWLHAEVWKDDEGFLATECEKTQQAQQFGCIDPKAVDAWFSSGGAVLAGAIDMRTHGCREERDLREHALELGLLPGAACRWGAACPRLSTDPEHGGHTAAQARLAEQRGVTAAVRALGGQWMMEGIRQARLEEVASRADACPCWKDGAGFCMLPNAHRQHYWQGEATMARLASLEPGVDQNPATFEAKREAKLRKEREKRERAAYLQSETLRRFGGPPPTFAPCWPIGAFESLPDEVLGKICALAGERGGLPGDMKSDVRRVAFVSMSILSRLRRVPLEMHVRACSGALQIDQGCWTVASFSLEHHPVQMCAPGQGVYWNQVAEAQKSIPRTLELLAQCCALQSITMDYAQELSSIEAIAACSELRKLTLSQLDGVTDVSPLVRCPKLEELTLSIGSHLSPETLLPLLESPMLRRLSFDCAKCRSMELPAPSVPNLGFLRGGVLGEVAGDWSTCSELRTLILAWTSVTKVAPLAGCPRFAHPRSGRVPAAARCAAAGQVPLTA